MDTQCCVDWDVGSRCEDVLRYEKLGRPLLSKCVRAVLEKPDLYEGDPFQNMILVEI